jgi:hypothetical protein
VTTFRSGGYCKGCNRYEWLSPRGLCEPCDARALRRAASWCVAVACAFGAGFMLALAWLVTLLAH